MQEPIAYFTAALSFYVTARVLVAPDAGGTSPPRSRSRSSRRSFATS